MAFIKKIDLYWSKWELVFMGIGCLAILVAMTITSVDVVMRNTINKSILGATELVSLLLMPVFVSALPYIQAKSNHVILEFATEKAPVVLKKAFDIFGCLIGLFLFSSIAQKCITTAIDSFTRLDKTMGAVSYYMWPAKFILAIAVISLIVRFVLDIILNVGIVASKDRGETPKAPGSTKAGTSKA